MEKRHAANGTYLLVSYPWGAYHGGRVRCPDGAVRALARISKTPDTFFSIPAAVKVRGKTVSGFVTSGDTGYEFCPIEGRKNSDVFSVDSGKGFN